MPLYFVAFLSCVLDSCAVTNGGQEDTVAKKDKVLLSVFIVFEEEIIELKMAS